MRVLRKKINLTILSRSLIDKTSICRYRKKPALDEGGNPLDWWRPRRPQFPRLKRPARKYFCILATSTQAERVFSWRGFLFNKRNRVQSMQLFLKDDNELLSLVDAANKCGL